MSIPLPVQAPSVRYLKGVGPKRALALEKFGIHSVRDLLYFFPRRYEDRSHFQPIAKVAAGQPITVRGEILAVKLKPIRRMSLLEMAVGDSTGMIHAVWFNRPYLKNQFEEGAQIILFGKVDLYQNRLQMNSPEYEILQADEEMTHTGRITPVYPLTEGLFQRSLRSTLKEVVQTQLDKVVSDYLPDSFRAGKKMMPLGEAVREMHFPSDFEKQNAARRRIVFDEFLLFELTLLRKMARMKTKYRAYPLSGALELSGPFQKALPFDLTESQRRALEETARDLDQATPMNRLLQGDVGAGKTVVAAFALLVAAKNNRQAALLVPTEILAEQHYRTLRHFLEPFAVTIGLLTASTPAARRERIAAELRQGKLSILIGTHALLSGDVQFSSLALVVIDEQHKFGVHQRGELLNKEPRPHQLVMTATPIPRTLALTVYGDLDISLMRELPRGRKPIQTYWIAKKKQTEVLQHILKKIKSGEQAYFIFPMIEETEKADLLAAKREYDLLKKGIFSELKLGLVHGRLAREEREGVMKAFCGGGIQVLVATSVVEVGVDNPNATVMVIENAERFGLSQLHQMRGRIGRGQKASECFLFGEPKTEDGQRRLRIMTKTQDGFLIAEEDLKLRGPGDFWGTRQSGEPLFRVADPILDQDLLADARQTAVRLIKHGEFENSPEWSAIRNFMEQHPIRY